MRYFTIESMHTSKHLTKPLCDQRCQYLVNTISKVAGQATQPCYFFVTLDGCPYQCINNFPLAFNCISSNSFSKVLILRRFCHRMCVHYRRQGLFNVNDSYKKRVPDSEIVAPMPVLKPQSSFSNSLSAHKAC